MTGKIGLNADDVDTLSVLLAALDVASLLVTSLDVSALLAVEDCAVGVTDSVVGPPVEATIGVVVVGSSMGPDVVPLTSIELACVEPANDVSSDEVLAVVAGNERLTSVCEDEDDVIS